VRGYLTGMATNVGDQFHPGQIVPVSGIYRCTTDTDHTFESTDVKEHRFPPLPAGCKGGAWVLERAATHH
jgi:hypothetical protein